jgi:hypothetical protein
MKDVYVCPEEGCECYGDVGDIAEGTEDGVNTMIEYMTCTSYDCPGTWRICWKLDRIEVTSTIN